MMFADGYFVLCVDWALIAALWLCGSPKQDGADGSTDFPDDSGLGHATSAAGQAQVSTAVRRFGAGSSYFDGTGSRILVANGRHTLSLSHTQDHTVEYWFRTSGFEMPCPSCPLTGQVMVSARATTDRDSHGFLTGAFKHGQTLWANAYHRLELDGTDIVTLNEWRTSRIETTVLLFFFFPAP